MSGAGYTRRRAVRLLMGAGAWATARPGVSAAQEASPSDRGIGGTGMVFEPGEDRGIGGTGVVGTIRGFGSIVVNDVHIGYGPTTTVSRDGQPTSIGNLAIGQVVRVLALPHGAGLFTRHIALTSEVTGRVDEVRDGHLKVMGQVVALGNDAAPRAWRIGQRVTVSGLRDPSGVIQASLVVMARGHRDRVVGQLDMGEGARALRIGALALQGGDARLVGRRVIATGTRRHGTLQVRALQAEDDVVARLAARQFLFEALVQKGPDGLVAGPNAPADTSRFDAAAVPDLGLYRAIVAASRAVDGTFRVEAVRVGERLGTGGGNAPGRGGGPQGPSGPGEPHRGGAGPAGFGDAPGHAGFRGTGGGGPGGGGPGGGGPGGGGPAGGQGGGPAGGGGPGGPGGAGNQGGAGGGLR